MSKKLPVDSDNYYLYPEWFEGGNESNQSQPSTSSYSYPTLEYIWSNAVRLTRTVHSNLQDEIEYLEKNISGGGGSCNCSELQYGIDKNSTKIYYNSVNITSNANKITNLSDIKLSRDGSQPMEGELICNNGLKTDTIKARTQSILDCQSQLRVNTNLGGDGDSGLWLGSDFNIGAPAINLYPYASSANGKIFIKTPRSDGIVIPRIEIPGKEDLVDIKIRESNIIPYDDNYQDLGSGSNRWKSIYAISGNFSGTIVPDAILTNSANISDLDTRVDYLEENLSTCNCSALQFGIDSNTTKIANLSTIKLSRDGSQTMTGLLKCASGLKTDTISSYENDQLLVDSAIAIQYLWGSAGLLLAGGHITEIHPRIHLLDKDSYEGSIDISTPGGGTGTIKRRIWIQGGYDNSWIEIHNANLIPGDDNSVSLGQSDKRWKELYTVKNIVSYIQVLSRIWSNNTFNIGHGTFSTEDSQIRFTSNDLALMTPNSNGTTTERISLTGNVDRSIVYIKNAHLLPYDNLSSYLGSSAHRWVEVFANTGSFTKIDALGTSILDIDDDVKLQRRLWGKNDLFLAGGDPSYGHAQIRIYNKSNLGHITLSSTDSSGVPTERIRVEGDQEISTIVIKKANIEPYDDDSYRLGSSIYRWSDIYAVNTHWGDLGFVEKICPKCNKKFKIGDNIILKVIRFSEEDEGIMTIPIHLECAKLPTKTIKRKYPVKERYYEWDERQGRVIAKWKIKKQKKKTKKKKLKSGYKINQKTGKIEAVNRKNTNLSEAIEEAEEEIEEIVYQEKEIKI